MVTLPEPLALNTMRHPVGVEPLVDGVGSETMMRAPLVLSKPPDRTFSPALQLTAALVPLTVADRTTTLLRPAPVAPVAPWVPVAPVLPCGP